MASLLVKLGVFAILVSTSSIVSAAKGSLGEKLDYADAQVALVNLGGFNSGFAIQGTAGKHLDKIMPNLSAEATVNYSLVSPSLKWFSTWEEKVNIFNLGAAGVYHYTVNKDVDVRGKVGLAFQNRSYSCSGCSLGYGTPPSSGMEVIFGVGATYALDKTKNVIVEWTRYGSVGYFSGGLQFKF